jgi:hypothetical protein
LPTRRWSRPSELDHRHPAADGQRHRPQPRGMGPTRRCWRPPTTSTSSGTRG